MYGMDEVWMRRETAPGDNTQYYSESDCCLNAETAQEVLQGIH